MLLKRIKTGSKIKVHYDSSNIVLSEYNETNKDLKIIFKRGAEYTYKDVSKTDYFRFEMADSQGKALNSHIKSYEFEKGGLPDVDSILKEINELKLNETKLKANELIQILKETINIYDENIGLSNKNLELIQYHIESYKNSK